MRNFHAAKLKLSNSGNSNTDFSSVITPVETDNYFRTTNTRNATWAQNLKRFSDGQIKEKLADR